MNLLPVITRELSVQSRLPVTFGVRVVGALVLLIFEWEYFRAGGPDNATGVQLFSVFNLLIFCAIWILTPLLVADSISSERREGTLGLLFLTPLRATDIVIAKGICHGLRALTVWLAVIPIMMIPVLMGGVGLREGILSLLFNVSALLWSLTAGLVASSMSKTTARALLISSLLGLLAMVSCLCITGFWVWVILLNSSAGNLWQNNLASLSPLRLISLGFFISTDMSHSWQAPTVGPIGTVPRIGGMAVFSCVAAGLALAGGIWLAAYLMRRNWKESPPPSWQTQTEKVLLRPVVGIEFLKRWQRRQLTRNPIGWLQRRSWSSRLTSWSWLGVTIGGILLSLADNAMLSPEFMMVMFAGLFFSLAVSAAGSFKYEKENAVLELLLVTPLKVRQLITGRFFALWWHFLPALLILVLAWVMTYHLNPQSPASFAYGGSVLSIPAVGLYFSLHRKSFMVSLFLTGLVAVLVPGIMASFAVEGFSGMTGGEVDAGLRTAMIWFLQLAIGGICLLKLHRDLERRNFGFQRDSGG